MAHRNLEHSFEEAFAYLSTLPNSKTPTLKTDASKAIYTAEAKLSDKRGMFIEFGPHSNTVDAKEWGNGNNTYGQRIGAYCTWLDRWISQEKDTHQAKYVVITENDESDWEDETGRRYHFPKRYFKHLRPNTRVIYYKGRLRSRKFTDRLSDQAHYFGIATVEFLEKDKNSEKGDYFAILKNYQPFTRAILAKDNSKYIEFIPPNRENNYWRDAVRKIDEKTYLRIINNGSEVSESVADQSNSPLFFEELESYLTDGSRRLYFSTRYERKRRNREDALSHHGHACVVCHFDFEKTYGEIGKGFIHVHHIKPLSESGETPINPQTDLVPICPNCHAMIHSNKAKTLTVQELVDRIEVARAVLN